MVFEVPAFGSRCTNRWYLKFQPLVPSVPCAGTFCTTCRHFRCYMEKPGVSLDKTSGFLYGNHRWQAVWLY
ncbi:hypothetical protein ACJEEN_04155 [Bacteroides clarus]|uniref:hypothetical protein n=1 Tax=Bacteroides clarus TaxID=626929 RepID=UPI003979B6A5